MTLSNISALFTAMLLLAFLPSVSSLTVAARSASFGFVHGLLVAVGIALGDVVFIIIAIYGLSLLAGVSETLFVWLKYLGGAYLIYLGIALYRSKAHSIRSSSAQSCSLFSSFLSGLLITLADQKAILFYLGFLPAFVDLSSPSLVDAGIIIGIALVSIGGAKLSYAALASRMGSLSEDSNVHRLINRLGAGFIVSVGVFLMVIA